MNEINIIAEAMLEKKAQNVCSLDFTNLGTAISDYFVICNAESSTQVVAIADYVEEMMFKQGNRKTSRIQGRENAFWIILDYGDIIVHVFQTEYRNFYKLEELWAESIITEYREGNE